MTTAVRVGALLAGVIYLVALLAVQGAGSVLLGGTDMDVGVAAGILMALGVAAATLGGAVGARTAVRRGAGPGEARVAAVVGPAVFALLGVLLIFVSGNGLEAAREVLTVAGAAAGGWLGALLVLRRLDATG